MAKWRFPALLLLLLQAPHGGRKGAHSARLGDFQVTVTAERIASGQDIQDYRLRLPAGYSVVLVFVRIKNVARYPSCSQLQEWLQMKQGYEYPKSDGGKLTPPKTLDVLPTDESSGAFAFQIKNGTEPAALRIARESVADTFCFMSQHRQTQNSGPLSVSLSLRGLPANAD